MKKIHRIEISWLFELSRQSLNLISFYTRLDSLNNSQTLLEFYPSWTKARLYGDYTYTLLSLTQAERMPDFTGIYCSLDTRQSSWNWSNAYGELGTEQKPDFMGNLLITGQTPEFLLGILLDLTTELEHISLIYYCSTYLLHANFNQTGVDILLLTT